MRSLYKLPLRLRSIFRWKSAELDLSEELQFHLQNQIDEFVAQGMNPKEARHAAFRSLGGVEEVKEECRDARQVDFIHNFLLSDLRFALRTLRRSPGFALVACMTLALGIGATTSIFSVVRAVIFAPLPFRQPENLVHLWFADGPPGQHYRRGDQAFFSSARPADLYDWRAQNQSFEKISAYRKRSMLLAGDKPADLVDGQEVFDEFFEMLGTPAQLGRGLQASDYELGGAHVVVISSRMWKRRLAANPNIVGTRISLDRESYQIVGVMPANFFPTSWGYPEFWMPHWADQGEKNDRKSWGLIPLARLKPGVTWEKAQTQLDVISARLIEDNPGGDPESAVVVPMDAQLIGSSWKLLLLLSCGVTLLLLIAFVNVGNLLLTRVLHRRKEFAIRSALGASRTRIAYQLFVESFVLSLMAGMIAFGLAFAQTKLMLGSLPQSANVPRLDLVRIDFPLLAFVCGICLVGSMLCSLAALKNSGDRSGLALKIEGRGLSSGRGERRVGQAFILSEFVFSLVLLILGTLLVQSFARLRRVDPGFDASGLLAFHVQVPAVSYGKFSFGEKDPRRERLYEQLERIISAVPGVDSVAMSALLPLRHEINPSPVIIAGREPPAGSARSARLASTIQTQTGIERVNPQYFRALRLKLVSGRFLEERDGPDAPMAAVVNQAFVKAFFPGENPIGKQVNVWYGKPVIVGVVADFKLNSLDRNALPEMFWSLRQDPWSDVWVMARTKSDPALISNAISKSIHNFDPELPLRETSSMTEVVSESLWLKRIAAVLIGLVAALAIILAGSGIYSVAAYSVTERTKEIGIRVAVGATPGNVLRLIMGETLQLTLLGCMLGCFAAYVAGRLATTQNYIAPSVASSLAPEKMNPLVFVLSSIFLCGLALAASLVPARRALRVDPIKALRHE